MRFLSSLFALLFGALMLLFAFDNRDYVSINFWPLPWELEMPLFLLGFALGIIGLLTGLVVGWWSAHPIRQQNRKLRKMLKTQQYPPKSSDGAGSH